MSLVLVAPYPCPHCGDECRALLPDGSKYTIRIDWPSLAAHAATCPQRVRIARVVDRPDPIQKLIPAAAKMREPITVRAKR